MLLERLLGVYRRNSINNQLFFNAYCFSYRKTIKSCMGRGSNGIKNCLEMDIKLFFNSIYFKSLSWLSWK